MLLNQLNYYSHLILNSKNKYLLNILFFLLFMYIYNLYINEFDVIECMKRSKPNTIELREEHIQFLENENKALRERLFELENSLSSSRDQSDLSTISHQSTINSLEENQKYLVDKISSLQSRIIEAKDIITEIAGDNVELRTNAIENERVFERTIRELDTAKRHCTDALNTLQNLTGPR